MVITPFRARPTLLLAVTALLFVTVAFSQDKPDRPPWAQKPKSTASASSTPKSSTASTSASAPDGEPGKIVQPTPTAPTNDSQDAAAQRGRIRVNVNLVNVLVSVLDERTGLLRTSPGKPSNYLKKALSRRSTSSSRKLHSLWIWRS
jgi:hypothetical protein